MWDGEEGWTGQVGFVTLERLRAIAKTRGISVETATSRAHAAGFYVERETIPSAAASEEFAGHSSLTSDAEGAAPQARHDQAEPTPTPPSPEVPVTGKRGVFTLEQLRASAAKRGTSVEVQVQWARAAGYEVQ